MVTESWLSDRDPNSNFSLNSSYNVARIDRETRKGGGVLALIKNDLKFVLNYNLSKSDFNCEVLSFDLFGNKHRLRFFLVYRPPNTTPQQTKSLTDFLFNSTMRGSPNIIVGDFNLPEINWISSNSPKLESSKIFWNFSKDLNLSQMVRDQTMLNHSHILDLVLTTNPEIITKCYVTDFVLSSNDHLGVIFSTILEGSSPPPSKQQVLDFKKADYVSLNQFFS